MRTTMPKDFHCNCVKRQVTIITSTAASKTNLQESHYQHKMLCPLGVTMQRPHQLAPPQRTTTTFKSNRRKRKRPNFVAQQLLVLVCAILIQQVSLLAASANQQTNRQQHQRQPLVRRSIEDGSSAAVAPTASCQQQALRSSYGGNHGCQAQTIGQQQQSSKKVFCFYDIQDDFRPQDLNPCLCTHVVYSYVAVRKNLSFIAGKKGDLRSLASLKRKNPNLKLLVSLRPDDYFSFESTAANFNANLANNDTLAPLQSTTTTPTSESALSGKQSAASSTISMNEMHQKFAKRIRDFIVRHSLDGINLDWPYFAQTMASINASREHLSLTLQAINDNFQISLAQSSPSATYLRLLQAPLVTLTTSKDFYSLVDGYDFHQLTKLVDYVHLPAFDFDLNVDQYSIGHPARLHGIFDAENLDTLVDLVLSSGLPSDQLIAGIPAHGVQITSKPAPASTSTTASSTADRSSSALSATSTTIDEQLEAAANISIVSHSEVCRVRDLARQNCSVSVSSSLSAKVDSSCWTMSRSRDLTAPFAYDTEHWIGFDDETSVKLKAKYVLLRHLAGLALFTVNHDDPAGQCGFGPFPLLATINAVLARAPAAAHSGGPRQPQQQVGVAGSSPRGYFTRAPSHMLTATSLVSQIFGNKLASQNSAPAPSSASSSSYAGGDLMQSASDEAPANHQRPDGSGEPAAASGAGQHEHQQLMSFVDIIEKYGTVNRLDGGRGQSGTSDGSVGGDDPDQQLACDDPDQQLACDKVGYQRYPRDCSRFYRCVQTPPMAASAVSGTKSIASTPLTPSSGPSADYVTPSSNSTQTTDASGQQASEIKIQQQQPIAVTSITRLQYECPSGLVFDEQYQICNWPSWSAQCTGSGEVNSITNSKFVCPNYGYFQNQENCEYFYYCSDYNRGTTQAYQFRCPFELGFDEEKLQCNWKWLVKGCNVTSSSSSSPLSSTTSANSTKTVLAAQKYLASLATVESGDTKRNDEPRAEQQQAPQVEKTVAASSEQVAGAMLSKRSLDLDDVDSGKGGDDDAISGRALAPALASHMTSLLASIAAVREHRLKKAGGSGASQIKPSSTGGTSGGSELASKYPSYVGTPAQSSSAAASPMTGTDPQPAPSTNSFRLRRRQQPSGSGTSSTAGDQDKQSVSASVPYRRRPPPPSMFSFLPNSAIYMVVDSLRSVGEAAADEVNRYMRLAGDRVRGLLGPHGPGAGGTGSATKDQKEQHSGKQRRNDNYDDDLSTRQQLEASLAKLAARLSNGGSTKRLSVPHESLASSANYYHTHQLGAVNEDSRRTKRTRRDTSAADEMDDLQALESAPGQRAVYLLPPPQANNNRPQLNQQQHYQDPLGRPSGYPLNSLDETAKRAVLGPEVKLYNQPSHLVLNQMSGISQQDYERLIRPSPAPVQHQQRPIGGAQVMGPKLPMMQHAGYSQSQQQLIDPMMSSGSERVAVTTNQVRLPGVDHNKVIDNILGQAREAFSLSHASQAAGGSHMEGGAGLLASSSEHVPYGMPVPIQRPVGDKRTTSSIGTTGQESSGIKQPQAQTPQQKRRSTMAMKLVTMALPKFNLMPTTTISTSTSTPPQQTMPTTTVSPVPSDKAKSYKSFLPRFSDVVVAPARNIMNKAMGFNRAVQDLISTLAPGGSSSATKSTSSATTPKTPASILSSEHRNRVNLIHLQQLQQQQTTPKPMRNFQPNYLNQNQQQQQQQLQQQFMAASGQMPRFQQQQHPMMQAGGQNQMAPVHQQQQQPQTDPYLVAESSQHQQQVNRTQGPLLLTESEARALSAQLDQLSKEQLEALSDDLFKTDQQHPLGGQHQQQQRPQQQDQQAAASTESPDYVVRLLKVLSQTSHNPEDIRLLDQLASQLNNPRPNGQDQSLIEIGQPDDLALLEALGMIPAQPQQHQQHEPARGQAGERATDNNTRYTVVMNAPENATSDQSHQYQQQAAPDGQANEMTPSQQQHLNVYMRPGVMKQLMHQPQMQDGYGEGNRDERNLHEGRQHQHQTGGYSAQASVQHADGMPTIELVSESPIPTTTTFVPVTLNMRDEPTTPAAMEYNSYSNQYNNNQVRQQQRQLQAELKQNSYRVELPKYDKPEPFFAYDQSSAYPTNGPYDYKTTTTSTTTTTTTPRPTQLVTSFIQEQVAEKTVPPVRQTYTELIESNVTTPDGIETSMETRTKTAISAGAGFNIGAQLGLGLIPAPFSGSLPIDSPMAEQQRRQQQQQIVNNTETGPETPSSFEGVRPTATKEQTNGATDMNYYDQRGIYGTGEQQAIVNSQQGQLSPVGLQEGGDYPEPNEGSFAEANEQQKSATGGRLSSSSTTSQVMQQGASQPLISRQSSASFSGPRSSGGSGLTSLGAYNFATQPVNQLEEVVIKKKFKPFPKAAAALPTTQTTSFTLEEVRTGPTPQPVSYVQQQQSQSSFSDEQATIHQQQQEQVKEDELSSVASALSGQSSGGQLESTSSIITRLEVQRQQKIAHDLKQVEQHLKDQQQQAFAQMGHSGQVTSVSLADVISTSEPAVPPKDSGRNGGSSKAVPKKGSSKKSRKNHKKTTTTTVATTTVTSTTTEQPIRKEPSLTRLADDVTTSTTTASTPAATSGGPSQAEETSFGNVLVELKRSSRPVVSQNQRQGTTSTMATSSSSTSAPAPTSVSGLTEQQSNANQRRKSRSKKPKGHRVDGDLESAAASVESSNQQDKRKQQHQSRRSSSKKRGQKAQSAGSSRTIPHGDRLAGVKSGTTGLKQDVQQQRPIEREHVAIYGTKSGFMPIIKPDDPNYTPTTRLPPAGNSNHLADSYQQDPLSFGASFTSSKQQPASIVSSQAIGDSPNRKTDEYRQQPQKQKRTGGQQKARKGGKGSKGEGRQDGWQGYFVRKLSDQISVVHLGNYSEPSVGSERAPRLIQVKLVILPSSPNNQLLNAHNWHHLATNYPQLFPLNLDELIVETIELGKTSIDLQNGGLIDEHLEGARHSEFGAKYARISELIEPKTFKALDEIVQRSSGQMFMIQQRDTRDRTIIAVIPDRPFIRSAMAPAGGYQRLVVAATVRPPATTTTTTGAPFTTTTTAAASRADNNNNSSNTISISSPAPTASSSSSNTTLAGEQTTPQKAATFSRAIQESIQEAIRQHYDTIKSQLRESMKATPAAPSSNEASADADEEYNRRRNWFTPSAEALVNIEQASATSGPSSTASSQQQDLMEASSSSTEYSIAGPVQEKASGDLPTNKTSSSSYSSQSVYEVDGADPMSLYGLDLISPDERRQHEAASISLNLGRNPSASDKTSSTPMPPMSSSPASQKPAASQQQQPKSRFISIGSHLIASPMKKIVDQAYVNHFYDHISDHQLAKSIGFDELGEQQQQPKSSFASSNQTSPSVQEGPLASISEPDQSTTPSPTQLGEDSLVPESACTRPGLFQHPFACNKFYECFWDKQLSKYTLHMFECPIKLAFDDRIVGCAMPIESSLCVNM